MCHAVCKDGLLRGGFAAGIEQQFPIRKVIPPEHSKGLGLQLPVAGNHRSHISGTHLAGFDGHISAFQILYDFTEHGDFAVLGNIESAAHKTTSGSVS